mgnify:CR=1 FL=1
MNLLFIQGGSRWKYDSEGTLYTDPNFNSQIWSRYKGYCDELTVVLRREDRIYTKEEARIKFNEIGYYKVTFTINTYSTSNAQFNPDNDFVSVGLRHVDTDEIYVGTSNWTYNSEVQQLTAQGIISIVDTTDEYELVNLTNHIIFLNSPDIKNINSKSYFANSFLTIIIEYLGRQGT